jgi:hypothetical protein
MTEEKFNIELQSIKNDIAERLNATNKLIYQILLRKLSGITYKNVVNEVGPLFYFLVDSYDGDKSVNDRLFTLLAQFRKYKK